MPICLKQEEIDELRKAQQDELLSTEVYGRLSKLVKDPHNAKLLKQIAEEERHHASTFSKYTGKTFPDFRTFSLLKDKIPIE